MQNVANTQLWCEARNYCSQGSGGEIVGLAPIISTLEVFCVSRCSHGMLPCVLISEGLPALIYGTQQRVAPPTLGATYLCVTDKCGIFMSRTLT